MRKIDSFLKNQNITPKDLLQFPFSLTVPVWDNPALLTFRLFVDSELGDDNNDGMSWQTPFKTLIKANNFLPQDLQGTHALIYIHPGTYTGTQFNKNNGEVKLLYGGACMVNETTGAYGAYCKAGSVNPARSNDQVIIICSGQNFLGFRGTALYWMGAVNFNFAWNVAGYTAWDRIVVKPDNNNLPPTLISINSYFISEGGLTLDLLNTAQKAFAFQNNFSGFIRSLKIIGGTGECSTASNFWRGVFMGEQSGEGSSFELSSYPMGFHPSFQPPGGKNWQVSGVRCLFTSAQGAHLFTISFDSSVFLYEQGSLPDANPPDIRLESSARGIYNYHSTIFNLVDNSTNAHTVKNSFDNITKTFLNPSLKSVSNNLIIKALSTVPADSVLDASNISFYLDEAGNKLKIKLKYSNGTIKNGEVVLI